MPSGKIPEIGGQTEGIWRAKHESAADRLKNGVDLRLIQELLGHEDISTTERYTHIQNDDMIKTYEYAHPRARKAKNDGTK